MEPSRASIPNLNPAIAALLSALVPGLGQFYNGQWGKGALFFFGTVVVGGGLVSSGSLERLEQSLVAGEAPSDLSLILLLVVLLLGLALWSVIDAVRGARAKARA